MLPLRSKFWPWAGTCKWRIWSP